MHTYHFTLNCSDWGCLYHYDDRGIHNQHPSQKYWYKKAWSPTLQGWHCWQWKCHATSHVFTTIHRFHDAQGQLISLCPIRTGFIGTLIPQLRTHDSPTEWLHVACWDNACCAHTHWYVANTPVLPSWYYPVVQSSKLSQWPMLLLIYWRTRPRGLTHWWDWWQHTQATNLHKKDVIHEFSKGIWEFPGMYLIMLHDNTHSIIHEWWWCEIAPWWRRSSMRSWSKASLSPKQWTGPAHLPNPGR